MIENKNDNTDETTAAGRAAAFYAASAEGTTAVAWAAYKYGRRLAVNTYRDGGLYGAATWGELAERAKAGRVKPERSAAAPKLFPRDRILLCPETSPEGKLSAAWLEAAAAAGASVTFLPNEAELAEAARQLHPTVIVADAAALEALCRPYLAQKPTRFVKAMGGSIRYAAPAGPLPPETLAFLREAGVTAAMESTP